MLNSRMYNVISYLNNKFFATSACLTGSRGMFYADIFRDLATQMIYIVYTEDRTASQLVEYMGKELDRHLKWALNLDIA